MVQKLLTLPLILILFAAPAAFAQKPWDESTATDLRDKGARYFDKEKLEAYVRSLPEFIVAEKTNLNLYFDFDYIVVSWDGVRHRNTYRHPIRETNSSTDSWVFMIGGTFSPDGNLMNPMDVRNARVPVEKAKGDEKSPTEKLPTASATPVEIPAKTEPTPSGNDESTLKEKRVVLNQDLLFPIPEESTVGFVIDHSNSIAGASPVEGQSYLEFAKKHLEATLRLLRPDQKFVVGFSGADSIYHDGELLQATPENIQSAIDWVEAYVPNHGLEDFDLAVQTIAKHQMPQRMLFLTDGWITPPRKVTQPTVDTLRAGHTVCDVAPIPNEDFQRLKRGQFSTTEILRQGLQYMREHNPDYQETEQDIKVRNAELDRNAFGFLKAITEGTGGTILPPVEKLPDEQAVETYRQWLEKVRQARGK